jgi:hypothetical protein
MSAVIAERELGCTSTGSTVRGRVMIEAPEPELDYWRCTYAIDLPGLNTRRRTAGIDSFQALQLAMQIVASELAASGTFKAGNLTIFDKPVITHDDLRESFDLHRLPGIDP